MLRRSHLRLQLGSKNTYRNSGIKREFTDHYRDIASEADRPQRPAPAHKLPQLVNVNKKCPNGLGGTTIEADSDTSYSFDGYRILGAAFRAHKQVYLRKHHKQIAAANEEQNNGGGTEFMFHDQHCMVVPDAYPKSTFHFLIMPRMSKYPHLKSIADLTQKDVPLLRHMDQVSAEIVKAIYSTRSKIPTIANRPNIISEEEKILDRILDQDLGFEEEDNDSKTKKSTEKRVSIAVSDKDLLRDWLFRPRSQLSHLHPISSLRFMSGMHTLPSLCPLHLHLTSLDMQSDALKNKKHYNTFTTQFFVSRARVEEEINTHRYVKLAVDRDSLHFAEQMENQSPMICAWCQYQCKSVPELKEHLVKCLSNNSYFTQAGTLNSA